jgi:hypothetical protein
MLNKQSNAAKLVATLVFLLIIVLVQTAMSYVYGPSLFHAIVSVVIITIALYLILTLDTQYFLISFLLLFGSLSVTVSCLIIEAGAYMIEVQEQGYITGATTRYALYALIFHLGAYILYALFRRGNNLLSPSIEFKPNPKIIIGFYILLLSIVVVLLGIIIVYGSPLTLGMNRTRYWKSVAPPGTMYLNSFLPQLSLVSGIFLTQIRQIPYRKVVYYIFSLTLLTQILQGEKFSGLVLSSYFFLLPTLFFRYRLSNLIVTTSLLFKSLLLITVAMIIVLINYALLLGDPLLALILIGNRISLQGQVWWATDRLIGIDFTSINFIVHQTLGFGASEYNRGLNYLTNLIAPSISHFYFDSGSRFTAGYPSILLLGTGYLYGVPLVLLSGGLMGGVFYILNLVIARKKVLFTIIGLKLFFAMYLAFSMGDLYLIFSLKFIIFIIFSVLFFYLDIIIIRNKKTNITL